MRKARLGLAAAACMLSLAGWPQHAINAQESGDPAGSPSGAPIAEWSWTHNDSRVAAYFSDSPVSSLFSVVCRRGEPGQFLLFLHVGTTNQIPGLFVTGLRLTVGEAQQTYRGPSGYSGGSVSVSVDADDPVVIALRNAQAEFKVEALAADETVMATYQVPPYEPASQIIETCRN